MGRNYTLRFRTVILSLLVPGLFLLTGVAAWILYERIETAIMAGLDKKLHVISTITAVAINGDEHQRMMEKRQISDLTINSQTGEVYGLDIKNSIVVRIDAVTGAASIFHGFPGFHFRGLAWNGGKLFTVNIEERTLESIDCNTGVRLQIGSLLPSIHALAFDPTTGQLVGVGSRLFRIDPNTAAAVPFPSPDADSLTGICFGPQADQLWGLDQSGTRLLQLDPRSGRVLASRPIRPRRQQEVEHPPSSTSTERPGSEDQLALRGLAYLPGSREFLSVQDRLVPIDASTFEACLDCRVEGFWNDKSRFYQNALHPMRRIVQNENIRMLYTQVLLDKSQIRYGIDGSPEDDFSPLGSLDQLPKANVAGLYLDVMNGKTFTSDVLPWEHWGLLKSCFAPIVDSRNEIVAMSGADLDVSSIRRDTGLALLKVALIFVASLALFGAIAVYLGRVITEPTTELTSATMRMAAGHFNDVIHLRGPQEITGLAITLNGLGANIVRVLERLDVQKRELVKSRFTDRLSQSIQEKLAPQARHGTPLIDWLTAHAQGGPKGSSGSVYSGSHAISWLARDFETPLENVVRRWEIANVLQNLLTRHFFPRACERVHQIIPELDGFIWIDIRAQELHGHSLTPVCIASKANGSSAWGIERQTSCFKLTIASLQTLLVGFYVGDPPADSFTISDIESDITLTSTLEARARSHASSNENPVWIRVANNIVPL